jgi:hypothetical protein
MTKVLVDYNNLSMMKAFNKDVEIKSPEPNYELWEFLVFETIIDKIYNFKFVDDVIIAKDNKETWRKKFFPRYKEKRKDQKDKEVDWDRFYPVMQTFFNDLNTYFPFKCLDVKNCEADDIIGVLCKYIKDKKVILSSDQDFKQLLNQDTKLYSLYHNDYVTCGDPERYLIESCLKGQAKDNILNVITPEDWPIEMRKPGFGDKKLESWLSTGLEVMLNKKVKYKKPDYIGEVLPKDRYKTNRILMDFNYIPESIRQNIINFYNENRKGELDKIYDYLKMKNWTKYLEEYSRLENLLIKMY